MPQRKPTTTGVEKHPKGFKVTYRDPERGELHQKVLRTRVAAENFAMRAERVLENNQEGIRFGDKAAETTGEQLNDWRDVLWEGFCLVAQTPYNEDLERRVKTLATAFRAVLPTLVKAEARYDDAEHLVEAREMRERIADLMAASVAPPQ